MTESEVLEKMTKALKIARAAWITAKLPDITYLHPEDTGRIAIAMLATKIFDNLGENR